MHYYSFMARTDPQLNLRLPAELKDMLDEAAARNKRSVTSETVDRLISSFSAERNPANLAFLMSRMEMRAVEAELETLELKAMILEMIWSLKAAILQVGHESLVSGIDSSPILADWQRTIDDATEKVGDISVEGTTVHDEAIAKLDELTAVVERTKKTYNEVARQRSVDDPSIELLP